MLIEEDEAAEILRAKQREREAIVAKRLNKIEKFEMIKPTLVGEAKGKGAVAKKGKAKTQAAKKKGKGKGKNDDSEDLGSIEDFLDDEDEDAVKP